MKIAFSKIVPLWYHGRENFGFKISWKIRQLTVKVLEYPQRENLQASHLFANECHTQHTGQFNTLFILHTSYMCIKVKWKVFILFISDSVKIFKFQLKNVKVSNCYFSYLSKGFLSNAINWVIEWSSEGLTDWLNDWLIGWLTQKFSFSPFPYNRDLGEHIRKLKKNFSPNLLISLLKIVAPKETVALAAHVTRK